MIRSKSYAKVSRSTQVQHDNQSKDSELMVKDIVPPNKPSSLNQSKDRVNSPNSKSNALIVASPVFIIED